MPGAQETLTNYLTPTIREVVRREVEDPVRAKGKLFGRPRIYNNLLSSQPLCFNLFGELTEDLPLATSALSELTAGRVHHVHAIDFEFSPGRGDARYTGDRSAFDVYIRYETPTGGQGFLGIEVKYHEGLEDPVAEHRPRYDELAKEMGCFLPEAQAHLKQRPLQQIWRDHLLVGAHHLVDGFDDACFVFLYPEENTACAQAVVKYADCLSDGRSFQPWTLESVWERLNANSDAGWLKLFHERYLAFD